YDSLPLRLTAASFHSGVAAQRRRCRAASMQSVAKSHCVILSFDSDRGNNRPAGRQDHSAQHD
ncbi:MAG: hypothetical protein P8L85_05805, partial [Rubripirellula sp.]|nr:hypothetical protein [Rubripirellula sp.]